MGKDWSTMCRGCGRYSKRSSMTMVKREVMRVDRRSGADGAAMRPMLLCARCVEKQE